MELVEELEKVLVGSGRWGASFEWLRHSVFGFAGPDGDGGNVWKIWRLGASRLDALEGGIRGIAEFAGT
jgi:hypothetical protein